MTDLAQELRVTFRYPAVRFAAVVAFIMLLSAATTGVFVWWPATSDHDRMKRDVARSRSEVVMAINQAKATEKFNRSQMLVDTISAKLKATVSQAVLTDHINTLAADLGIKILTESNEEGKVRLGYRPMVQELSIQGDYDALRRFLSGINMLPTWTTVQELRVTRKNLRSNLKAVITLVTYRRAMIETPPE